MVDERIIKVDYLARVEGEGKVYVKLKGGKIERVEVGIFESPRFFEAFLRGRRCIEVPDITARICGICYVAHMMSSIRAFEKLFGVEVSEEIKTLRRMIYLGQWIESHMLHIAMLHAPDFLGYHSIIDMVKDFPEFVKDSLIVRAWGNKVIEVIGGRPVHPVSCRVGGFHRIIRRDELLSLLKNIYEVKHAARRILEFVLKLPIPDIKRDVEYVSLRGYKEYPVLEGRVVSNKGLDIAEDELEKVIEVEQVPYSTALRYRIKGRGAYIVGPIARFNNNYDLLLPEVREVIEAYGYKAPLTNTYQSIIARAAEVYQAVLELEELMLSYREPKEPYIEGKVRAGWGAAITEAPRGILYHAYNVDDQGFVTNANIITPTAQNLAAIEEDIKSQEEIIWEESLEKARLLVEQAIRNYDPCISCSVHSIKVIVEKE